MASIILTSGGYPEEPEIFATINTWYVYYNDGNADRFVAIVNSPGTNSPVSFNGREYYPMKYADTDDYTKFIVDRFFPTETLYYREEDGKVYRFDESLGIERQMFDFNLRVGDKVMDGDGNKMVVLSAVDREDLPGNVYLYDNIEAFRLQYIDEPSKEDIWIKGVGSLTTGLLCPSDLHNPAVSHLVFNKGLFKSCLTFPQNHSTYKALTINKETIEENVNYDDLDVRYEFVNDTLHVSGISYARIHPYDLLECHVEDKSITIDLLNIDETGGVASGELFQYDVKFPGFEKGTYTIKTHNSLNMLKNDTTITCKGTMATDIKAVSSQSIKQRDKIFDLTGRRISVKPRQGIYIKDGKKYMKL